MLPVVPLRINRNLDNKAPSNVVSDWKTYFKNKLDVMMQQYPSMN